MRFPMPIFAICLLATTPVNAQSDQVNRGPIPDWATPSDLLTVPQDAAGLMFMRRQDFVVHLDEQGEAHYMGYRTRILHPNALQLGNLSITWRPASGAPIVHVIKIYRGSETIDVLSKASFEILRREDQLEAARLDGLLTAVLRIPDLRVGDELEFAATTRSDDPTLGTDVAGMMMLAPEPQPGRFRLALNWDKGQEPRIKMTPDMAAVVDKQERMVEFRFDNPALLTPPKDAPARYRLQRIVEYSDFPDWVSVSKHFSPLYAKAAQLAAGSPLKQEAARIAAAHARPMDRATAALKLVQQDVRYIYVGLGSGNLIPATADETWQRRYGDCKGKTALLLGLLTELGVDAEAVVANNSGADDGLDERLPSPAMFDHVLVRARIDGATYWLDGTMPPVVSPSAKPVMPYRWVLPLTAKGSSIERLPWQPAEQPEEVTLHEIDARAGFDQPAKIISTTISRGIKGLQQQIQFSAVTPSQLLGAFRQQAVGDTWQTIDDVQWRYDQKAQASVLTISGTGVIDWDDDGDGVRSLSLPGGGFSPPERRIRAADQDQNLSFYNEPGFTCHVTTVRIPSATRPVHWSFGSDYDTRIFGRNYYRVFDFHEGAMRMIRSSRTEGQEVEAVKARQDNGRIAAFDNSMAWIYYDPASKKPPARGKTSVPATYEMDWTTDNVPCLAANKTS